MEMPAISSILQNTFNVYRSRLFSLSSEAEEVDDDFDYQQYCNDLAQQLFDYANTL
jgi:hypothetical protein